MHASYALPGVFKPVCVKGRWLMDGALVNPIPVSVCRALGARIVIAVNLNHDVFGKGSVIPDHNMSAPCEPREEEEPSTDKNGYTALQLLHRQFLGGSSGSAPGITSVMVDAFNITQDRIARARLAGDPPDITIRPHMSGIGMFDFHRGAEAIPLGEQAAERVIDEMQSVVNLLSPAGNQMSEPVA